MQLERQFHSDSKSGNNEDDKRKAFKKHKFPTVTCEQVDRFNSANYLMTETKEEEPLLLRINESELRFN